MNEDRFMKLKTHDLPKECISCKYNEQYIAPDGSPQGSQCAIVGLAITLNEGKPSICPLIEDTVKYLEVRDAGTRMPVMAVIMRSDDEKARKILRSSGFSNHSYLVLLHFLVDGGTSWNVYHWADRTRENAHRYITDNWDILRNGDVVDVQFILGETDKPKESEIQEMY